MLLSSVYHENGGLFGFFGGILKFVKWLTWEGGNQVDDGSVFFAGQCVDFRFSFVVLRILSEYQGTHKGCPYGGSRKMRRHPLG